MRRAFRSVLLASLLLACGSAFAQHGEVKMWEATLTMPTYEVAPAEKSPSFSHDFGHQRAKRGIYPYPKNDNPTNRRSEQQHKALFLENDYVELCITPDLGGRIFYAIDKTNGYDIFYRQHVVKPQNVGMLGAWISGGVEWNVFHHHRASSQFPVDYQLVDNGDGSKTIWVGEVEPRHRMSWSIGVTLHPDKSYMEVTGRLINCTADRNSILYWANVATHANDDYQIIFPGTTDFGTYHAKNSFIRWPNSDAPYCGMPEYADGIDASWWKNHPKSTSIFIYDLQDDYVGGYDHEKKAGTMLVGNHNINKGGKFWLWGPKAYGHMWDCVALTDNDGPYVELMVAAYSDNQPDYCWINPYEVKAFSHYWYGIRDLNNVDRGNKFATLNMERRAKNKLFVAANVTEIRDDARLVVTGTDGGVIWQRTARIAPDRPFAEEITVDPKAIETMTGVTMTLYSAQGEELLAYTPREKDPTLPYPELMTIPPEASQIDNVEELYFTGMRNLQFHNAHVDPNDYFLRALSIDPFDTRSNTQMGIFHRKRGQYDKAAEYLRAGLKRQTKYHTRPANGETLYNLGLVHKALGNREAAIDTLYRAAWDYAWASPSYYQLAQISAHAGQWENAEKEALMSVRYNGMNFEARNIYTTLLRRAGKTEQARQMAESVLELDPLNFYATYEMSLLGAKTTEDFRALLRDVPESYLETACYYMANGFDSDAAAILGLSDRVAPYPTVKYWLGYISDKAGDRAAAAKYFADAAAMPVDYCFPYRLETISVYEKALAYMPQSDVTYYYLGNLLFDKQPDRAMECWAQALAINPSYAMALRNLGWGYRYHRQDLPTAIGYYERAIASDRERNAMFLTELDELYALTNAPIEKRYKTLASNHETAIKRYDSFTREIRMAILTGEYEKALDYLLNNYFCRSEHVDNLHDIYVDACLLLAERYLNADDTANALKYYKMADEYPPNQLYARLEFYPRNAQVYYLTGLAYEKSGDRSAARKYYKMVVETATGDEDYNYEKALAMKKLDPKADVDAVFRSLVRKGESEVTDYVERFYVGYDRGEYPRDVNSRAYYTAALGYKGLGDENKARECFSEALRQRNDNLWAGYYLTVK